MPIKSTLSKRGRHILGRKDIAIRPKPFKKKPLPQAVPWEYAYMSSYEWRVFRALKKRHIAFTEQVSFFGGAGFLGGTRVDFVLLDRPVILRVQGPWHTAPHARARDELQRLNLQAQGYTVIDLWQADLADLDRALTNKLGVPVRAG